MSGTGDSAPLRKVAVGHNSNQKLPIRDDLASLFTEVYEKAASRFSHHETGETVAVYASHLIRNDRIQDAMKHLTALVTEPRSKTKIKGDARRDRSEIYANWERIRRSSPEQLVLIVDQIFKVAFLKLFQSLKPGRHRNQIYGSLDQKRRLLCALVELECVRGRVCAYMAAYFTILSSIDLECDLQSFIKPTFGTWTFNGKANTLGNGLIKRIGVIIIASSFSQDLVHPPVQYLQAVEDQPERQGMNKIVSTEEAADGLMRLFGAVVPSWAYHSILSQKSCPTCYNSLLQSVSVLARIYMEQIFNAADIKLALLKGYSPGNPKTPLANKELYPRLLQAKEKLENFAWHPHGVKSSRHWLQRTLAYTWILCTVVIAVICGVKNWGRRENGFDMFFDVVKVFSLGIMTPIGIIKMFNEDPAIVRNILRGIRVLRYYEEVVVHLGITDTESKLLLHVYQGYDGWLLPERSCYAKGRNFGKMDPGTPVPLSDLGRAGAVAFWNHLISASGDRVEILETVAVNRGHIREKDNDTKVDLKYRLPEYVAGVE